jgi:hypothetical protein
MIDIHGTSQNFLAAGAIRTILFCSAVSIADHFDIASKFINRLIGFFPVHLIAPLNLFQHTI